MKICVPVVAISLTGSVCSEGTPFVVMKSLENPTLQSMYQISIFGDLSQGQAMNQTLRSFIIGLIYIYTIFDFILLNNSYLCHFFSGMKYIIIGTEEEKKSR